MILRFDHAASLIRKRDVGADCPLNLPWTRTAFET